MMGKTKFYMTTKNRIKFGLVGKKIYGIDRDRACQHNRAPLKTDGWMVDYLWLNVLFNSISLILGRWLGDNEKLCAMEPRLRLERFPSQAGLEPGTARSVAQLLTYLATGRSAT